MANRVSSWRFLIGILGLIVFVLVLIGVFQNLLPGSDLISSSQTTKPSITQTGTIVKSGTQAPLENPYPYYPPPESFPTPYFQEPEIVRSILNKKELLGNVSAATIDTGRMWLISPDEQAKPITNSKDVSVIYGWNYNGTKLLFGRGLYKTNGEMAKATELWIYEMDTGVEYRLVDSTRIWSASWSPVDDRVAYCEYGERPTVSVVSLDGKVQLKRNDYLFSDLAWSLDGSAIAVSYSGPDMVEFDTRFSVLGIWWIEKDELELLSDAKKESHYMPVWLMDGSQILFTRIFGPGSEGGESGLFIVDIYTKQISPLPNGPEYIINSIMRSPRSDNFIFWMGYDIYVMELGKTPILIGKGSKPAWHPDGKTIFYQGENGLIETRVVDLPTNDQIIGGYFTASTIQLQPSISFKWNTSQ